MKVGVLALQGDVPEHIAVLGAIVRGDDVVPVRTAKDLAEVAALFMPGGESTTIARLLVQGGLWNPLADRLKSGMPVLATCAGLILLSHELVPSLAGMDPPTFDVLNVQVRRNDYGSQGESFEAPIRVEGMPGGPFPGVFIRSPRIHSVGEGVSAFAWHGSEVVGVRAGSIWGLAFHPELSGDPRMHRLFVESAHAALSVPIAGTTRPKRRSR
jgi:pyridoxal 5'-phosphate synthase pdxT subunit